MGFQSPALSSLFSDKSGKRTPIDTVMHGAWLQTRAHGGAWLQGWGGARLRSRCQDTQAWEVCSWEAQEDKDTPRGQSDPQALRKILGFPARSRTAPEDPNGARGMGRAGSRDSISMVSTVSFVFQALTQSSPAGYNQAFHQHLLASTVLETP